jgi:hypothetical protein
MRPPQHRCFYCNEPATLLCDYTFGWPIGARATGIDGTERKYRALAAPYTCNMPLCRGHAEYRGWIHIKAQKPIGGFDTRDYCPEHAGSQDTTAQPIEQSEADRLRHAVRENARRRIERERGISWSPPLTEQGELF